MPAYLNFDTVLKALEKSFCVFLKNVILLTKNEIMKENEILEKRL